MTWLTTGWIGKRFRNADSRARTYDLDAVYVRHPLAQGLLSLKEAILWTSGWAGIALVGALLLNPVCALVFLAGCLAETVYCLMFRVSHLRILVSGVVKTAGGIAAVFAVEPNPSLQFLACPFRLAALLGSGRTKRTQRSDGPGSRPGPSGEHGSRSLWG